MVHQKNASGSKPRARSESERRPGPAEIDPPRAAAQRRAGGQGARLLHGRGCIASMALGQIGAGEERDTEHRQVGGPDLIAVLAVFLLQLVQPVLATLEIEISAAGTSRRRSRSGRYRI
jgi:hypothetical protein